MLLLRGATGWLLKALCTNVVSIHAPLARSNFSSGTSVLLRRTFQYMLLLRGATRPAPKRPLRRCFNTCSSCEEQPLVPKKASSVPVFQYMLLLRGATELKQILLCQTRFNTCSSCEEQQSAFLMPFAKCSFNTCSSCEEQPLRSVSAIRCRCFNTCSSCEEQLRSRFVCRFPRVSIHAPLARSNYSSRNA